LEGLFRECRLIDIEARKVRLSCGKALGDDTTAENSILPFMITNPSEIGSVLVNFFLNISSEFKTTEVWLTLNRRFLLTRYGCTVEESVSNNPAMRFENM